MSSSNGHGTTRQRLAVAAYERRQAVFEAGAESQIPPAPRVPVIDTPARDKLPTLDDLIGPEAPKARWKLLLKIGGALVTLGALAQQIISLFGK